MLRKWWAVLFFVGVLVLAVLLFSPTADSTLAQEDKIQALMKNPTWEADLLLPTSLPGTVYVREALVTERTEQSPSFAVIDMDLMRKSGGEIARFRISEQKSDRQELPTVGGVPMQAVKQVVAGKRRADTLNGIGKLEEMEIGDGTGYWFTRVDAAHGQFEEQVVEFLQNGYWVQMSVNLPESSFAKEKLIGIAQSFRKFE